MNTQNKIKAIKDKLEKLWYVQEDEYMTYQHAVLPHIEIGDEEVAIWSINPPKYFKFNDDNWFEEFNKAFDEIVNNTLGKNTVRMMQIGQVQDKLEKLGFDPEYREYGDGCRITDIHRFYNSKPYPLLQIGFFSDFVQIIGDGKFYYNSPTFETDLLNRVKELIDE